MQHQLPQEQPAYSVTPQPVSENPQTILSELILAICDPLTVVLLTLESLKPGEALSEADHRLMLQNVHHINKIIRCYQQS